MYICMYYTDTYAKLVRMFVFLNTLSFLEDQIQKKLFSKTDACFHVKLMQGIQKYELILNPTSPF